MTVPRGCLTGAIVGLAIAALGGCSPSPAPGAASVSPGARLYAANCAACHRPDGSGVPSVQPPLAGTPVAVGPPAELLGWVLYGHRPAALPRGVYAGAMPQFSYLADADVAVLLTYVRASFGNHAQAITPAMVQAARASHAAR